MFWDDITNGINNIGQRINSGISNIGNKISDAATWIGQRVQPIVHKVSSVVSDIANHPIAHALADFVPYGSNIRDAIGTGAGMIRDFTKPDGALSSGLLKARELGNNMQNNNTAMVPMTKPVYRVPAPTSAVKPSIYQSSSLYGGFGRPYNVM